jgi:hypothetical protein
MITRPYFTIEQPKSEKIETRLVRGTIREPYAYHDNYRISRIVIPRGMGFVAIWGMTRPEWIYSKAVCMINRFVSWMNR